MSTHGAKNLGEVELTGKEASRPPVPAREFEKKRESRRKSEGNLIPREGRRMWKGPLRGIGPDGSGVARERQILGAT